MANKLVVFDQNSFSGTSKIYQSNDPDLVANGDDFVLSSAIAVVGSWTLYDQVGHAGTSIQLDDQGGPDSDGAYKDSADWQGATPFHVRSIEHA